MNAYLIIIVQIAEQIISLLIIVHVILSYFMSPYHPVRETIDRLVEPMLSPIRQIMPKTGMFDFSPLVLLIGVQVLAGILVNILRSIG
jgi:YggT family protein